MKGSQGHLHHITLIHHGMSCFIATQRCAIARILPTRTAKLPSVTALARRMQRHDDEIANTCHQEWNRLVGPLAHPKQDLSTFLQVPPANPHSSQRNRAYRD